MNLLPPPFERRWGCWGQTLGDNLKELSSWDVRACCGVLARLGEAGPPTEEEQNLSLWRHARSTEWAIKHAPSLILFTILRYNACFESLFQTHSDLGSCLQIFHLEGRLENDCTIYCSNDQILYMYLEFCPHLFNSNLRFIPGPLIPHRNSISIYCNFQTWK